MERHYPEHLTIKSESQRLVSRINNYWHNKGYPHFFAWVEEELINGDRCFVIRSNIKQRATP